MLTFDDVLRKLAEERRKLILASPAPGCPACLEKRLHSADEDKAYHPWKGHGGTRERDGGMRWSHPNLQPKETGK